MANGSGIKGHGIKEAVSAITCVGKYFSGLDKTTRRDMSHIIGDDMSSAIKRGMIQKYGKAGSLVRSIKYQTTHSTVWVYTDPDIAPHGAIREVGGTIKAFRSKFVNPKTGEHLLFVPRDPDIRPADWKRLEQGVDYWLTPQVTQKGSHFMRRMMNIRLGNGGWSPRLSDKIGKEATNVFKRMSKMQ